MAVETESTSLRRPNASCVDSRIGSILLPYIHRLYFYHYIILSCFDPPVVNGALHWITYDDLEKRCLPPCENGIMAFRLEKELPGGLTPMLGDKKLDDVIDLVIPRGNNKLVSQIKASTKVPVLGHADGIFHVYVDKSADIDKANRTVVDAKTDYPAACNAMETLFLHRDLAQNGGQIDLIMELQTKEISLYGGPKASSRLKIPGRVYFIMNMVHWLVLWKLLTMYML